jgi:hypothetical protein
MTDEQLRQLAVIAHCCYGSFDLALRCVALLQRRQVLPAGSQRHHAALLRVPWPRNLRSRCAARCPRSW